MWNPKVCLLAIAAASSWVLAQANESCDLDKSNLQSYPVQNVAVQETYDVIIVGGGAMGLSAAAALADTNTKVLVAERFQFFHDNGGSAGMSRQFRLQYAQSYMSALVQASVPYWDKLQKFADTLVGKPELITKVGSLWFGDPDQDTQEGGISAAEEVMKSADPPIEFTPLNAEQIEDRFNFANLPKNYNGFYQQDGGIIDLKATLKTLYAMAEKDDNIDLSQNTRVTNIESQPDGKIFVTVDIAGVTKRIRTKKLIITSGAHTNEVLSHLGLHVDLKIWRMSSAHYEVKEPMKNFPTWFAFQEPVEVNGQKPAENNNLFYGFPEVDWDHAGYARVAPDIPDNFDPRNLPTEFQMAYDSQSIDRTTAFVQKHMPNLVPDPMFMSTCQLPLSAKGKELLLDHPPKWVHNHKDIVIYTAGWAAKFVPLIGQILANEVTGKKFPSREAVMMKDALKHFKIHWQDVRGEVSKHFDTRVKADLKVNVAIVGGGAAGLYTGYRLKHGSEAKQFKGKNAVQIFEMSNRIGGRLKSVRLPGMTNVLGSELGGMRYMHEHKIVTALTEKVFSQQYGLENITFPMGDASHHLLYLRKQRFFADSFDRATITGENFTTRYVVDDEFHGKSANDIFGMIIDKVLQADNKPTSGTIGNQQTSSMSRQLWNEVKKTLVYRFNGSPYDGEYVYNIGFWNLLKDQSSQEVYEFLKQAGGYYSNTINWNSAEAFPYMMGDFANGDATYSTIKGGYDQVLTSLASSFVESGGKIRTMNQLLYYHENPDPHTAKFKYVLTFYNLKEDREWTVLAKQIVLAMPRRSLELVNESFLFSPTSTVVKSKHFDINNVISEPSMKLLLGFEIPWWRKQLGAHHGESITDLPMRQCYYFGTDESNSHSLFLSSYNDMTTTTFWETIRRMPVQKFQDRSTALVKASNNDDDDDSDPGVVYPAFEKANVVMVAEAMKQVRELHGDAIDIPEPYTTAFKSWTDDPYGGGYHAWRTGKVWKRMPAMRHPAPMHQIFIVGEAYSEQQGWVEGALCTAEHVLRDHFGLQEPTWLEPDYYLGW
eukprot:m.28117 g.28117  ORF g.28117 m.28117 type:complete len:1050 (-) comp15866_c1_seq1:135-3284(-)